MRELSLPHAAFAEKLGVSVHDAWCLVNTGLLSVSRRTLIRATAVYLEETQCS